jgi:lipopolysaccharide transport system permease protein
MVHPPVAPNRMDITEKIPEEITFIRPERGWSALNLKDLWRYRELIYFLIWRDIKVRYKQTALGIVWAVLQPIMTMIVFNFIFGNLAKVPTGGVPYPIFSFAGLLPWGLFTKAIGDAGRSLIQNRTMITKVYFPRLVIPLASVLSGLVDFGISFLVLIAIMIYYNFAPNSDYHIYISWRWLTLPLFLLLAIATSLAVGLWLSALNVIYRDVNYILPFLTQFWLFITPVGYPTQIFSEKWQFLISLNPMTGVVEGFRWALLGTQGSAIGSIGLFSLSVTISLVALVGGLYYFRRMERTFADEI